MHDVLVVLAVPGTDVRRVEQSGRPVIGDTLVERCLAIVLKVARPVPVPLEIRRVAGDVMRILVVQDGGIMRGVVEIAAPAGLDEGAEFQKLPSRSNVNLSVA
jgi:hypothetical protein